MVPIPKLAREKFLFFNWLAFCSPAWFCTCSKFPVPYITTWVITLWPWSLCIIPDKRKHNRTLIKHQPLGVTIQCPSPYVPLKHVMQLTGFSWLLYMAVTLMNSHHWLRDYSSWLSICLTLSIIWGKGNKAKNAFLNEHLYTFYQGQNCGPYIGGNLPKVWSRCCTHEILHGPSKVEIWHIFTHITYGCFTLDG